MELEINEDKYLNYMVIRKKILEEKYSRGLFEFLLIVKIKEQKRILFIPLNLIRINEHVFNRFVIEFNSKNNVLIDFNFRIS